jgi:hypothetical protein
MQPRSQTETRELGYDRGVLAKGITVGLAALALAPSAASVPPPTQPGPWKQVGKAATSRIGVKLHIFRTAVGMKALAFVVTSRSSSRRVKLEWTSYCEEQSDDGYTETFQGKLSALRLVTHYPQVFDGATQCNVVVNVAAIKGFRVSAAVFSY